MTSQRTRDRLAARLHGKGVTDTRVLEAIRHTPRHIFVDEALSSRAYEDTALPIGHGQTISQPYVVARMTEALLAGGDLQKVLEIGTGSGYQAALLAQLVPAVYTVERIAALCELARERFHLLGLSNVRVKQADGYEGWAEHAPFDAVMVTAAPTEVPPALLAQLADGGRMVIPVGHEHSVQQLSIITREGSTYTREVIDAVSFVPLVKPQG
ncbi:MAG: protein-L-isoaspartate(D-aspartate) O-methyltransferase [Gammaproteobacteria bacterium]